MMQWKFVVASLGLSAFAWAQPASVKVQADIVVATVQAGEVDKSLERMRAGLADKVKYGSLKKVSSKTLDLSSVPTAIELPNKKTAQISLLGVKENVATVKVALPPTEATYTLAKDKSLYVQAGVLADADVWLVLSQPK
jgi:hypothetical protein